jgi:CBS domain-containing protein
MLRSSLPLGRIFNVDLRVHLSFPLLLLFAIVYSVAALGSPGRGIALWLTLCCAVFVRELARSIAAAYAGLRLRAIFLLPIGGVMAFTSGDGAALQTDGKSQLDTRWVNLSGPIANFAIGLLLLGFSLAFDPRVSLFAQPWVGVHHILRSLIWMQILMGAANLLPTSALPVPQLLRATTPRSQDNAASTPRKLSATRPAFSIGTLVAIAMIVAGVVYPDAYFLIILGAFLLLYLQVNKLQSQVNTEGDAILVRDVMLTEYTLLSSSDTLRHALDCTIHSLQDIFPVVRGNRLVGSIARQSIAEHLLTDGDSYLQGAMTRNLQIATPDEKLGDALRRASSLGASEFVPVVENNALIGILTPQSLGRAVQQVKLTRPATPQRERQS